MSFNSDGKRSWNFQQIGKNFPSDDDDEAEGEQLGMGGSKRQRTESGDSSTNALSEEGNETPSKSQSFESGTSSVPASPELPKE